MSSLKTGDQLITFSLPGVDGNIHNTADYTDRQALAVIFTCNHCPYVLAWEDRMIGIQADYADKGVQLLTICSNDAEKYPADSFPAMQEHAKEKGFNFPYLHDATQEVARAYGAERTPEVFLFDSAGILRYHGAIDNNYDDPSAVSSPYLRNALDAVLAQEKPAVQSTPPVGCTIKWKA